MITREPSEDTFRQWKAVWSEYVGKLEPNRKSGKEIVDYLQQNYVLTEMYDKEATEAVFFNVTENKPYAKKLPAGVQPLPRTFFLENAGNGEVFYREDNQDPVDLWGGEISRVFVGIDEVTGFFMVEGSTMLWDELLAFRGLDEEELQNYVWVAEYIDALKRFDRL